MLQVITKRNFWIMLVGDALFVLGAYYLSYFLRFDGDIPARMLGSFYQTVIWIVPLKLACFFFFRLYKGMWRYTSINDLINLTKACLASSALIIVLLLMSVRFVSFARSVFVIDFFLTFVFVGGYRISVRMLYPQISSRKTSGSMIRADNAGKKRNRALLIGAGDAGEKLLREILDSQRLRYEVVGFVDDDDYKIGQSIHGVSVLGKISDVGKVARKKDVDELIIAVPSVSGREMRRIVNECERTGLPYKTLPGMSELIEGRVSVRSVREIYYEDLIGRKQVRLNMEQIGGYLRDMKVMVTGGAGSIGSELCRQVALFKPRELILVDQSESGLYDTEHALLSSFDGLRTASVLGSVQDRVSMERVFDQYRPGVVFHAAAYKHVPMLEEQPWEAVMNNILGTKTVLTLCAEKQVDRCVVVSTDKAVRPTNVMGATKRVDEVMCQVYGKENKTRYMAVRFGNVVYSAGSVVPLFQRQIKSGGPVTVTHPEVTRYFMTIPEAARLILQAGAIGRGGEIFILKMGTPIRIADMARDIIRLSGYRPDEDIEIKYTGLRPGEKLYEELITEGEGIQETEHEEIMVLQGHNSLTREELEGHIENLVALARLGDQKGTKEELKKVVPEYSPQY